MSVITDLHGVSYSVVLTVYDPSILKIKGLIYMFITRIFYGIAYFIVLIWEIIKATIDVAIRTVNGKVDPVIVEIPTVLKRPVSQTILANSITLTPGTLSIDLDSEKQVIKVATIVPRKNEEVIPFEPYIKGMLE
jgi:energy-converting hydrogenase B subunit A